MKHLLKLSFIIIIAVIIEIVFFNFSYIADMANYSLEKNRIYNSDDMDFVNWTKANDEFESKTDPMIVISDINSHVKDIELRASFSKVPFIMFYYTNEKEESFNDNMSLAITEFGEDFIRIKPKTYIKDLRIDMGDEAGTRLKEITVIINPSYVDFNVSRVVAIILIVVFSILLSKLQKGPDYDILNE